MRNKTAPINCMIEEQLKENLQKKAKALGLTLTAYLEKIAREPIIFIDSNLRAFADTLKVGV